MESSKPQADFVRFDSSAVHDASKCKKKSGSCYMWPRAHAEQLFCCNPAITFFPNCSGVVVGRGFFFTGEYCLVGFGAQRSTVALDTSLIPNFDALYRSVAQQYRIVGMDIVVDRVTCNAGGGCEIGISSMTPCTVQLQNATLSQNAVGGLAVRLEEDNFIKSFRPLSDCFTEYYLHCDSYCKQECIREYCACFTLSIELEFTNLGSGVG